MLYYTCTQCFNKFFPFEIRAHNVLNLLYFYKSNGHDLKSNNMYYPEQTVIHREPVN